MFKTGTQRSLRNAEQGKTSNTRKTLQISLRQLDIPRRSNSNIRHINIYHIYILNIKINKEHFTQPTFTSISPILLTALIIGRPTIEGKM